MRDNGLPRVATFGLLLTSSAVRRERLGSPLRGRPLHHVGLLVYRFTSFANPAVTIARSISDTFAGIAPSAVPAFIMAQLAGMGVAVFVGRWLWESGRSEADLRE